MRIAILLTILCLAGCAKVTAPPEDETLAKGYIDLLRQKNYAPIEQHLDPSLQTQAIHQQLVDMAGLIPPGEPLSTKLVGSDFKNMGFFAPTGSFYRTKFLFEYQYPNQWVAINVTLQKAHDTKAIIGFNVVPLTDSLENLNRFTFDGKGPLHYIVFALSILIPLFILYALVVCLLAKGLRWKWLWLIFILFGLGDFALNWTSGEWLIGVFNMQFLGAGAQAVPYGPWIFSISLPVGAIIFLLRRRKLASEIAE